MDLIAQRIDALPYKSLPSVVENIISHMENTVEEDVTRSDDFLSLNLLTRCFSAMVVSSSAAALPKDVEAPDRDGVGLALVFAPDYVNHSLKRIISASLRWPKSVLTKIASMLRDLPLSEQDCAQLIKLIFTQMKVMEPLDLPSLVYQLLLLASKQCKRIILSGILSFFSICSSSSNNPAFARELSPGKMKIINKNFSAESFRQIEGTIMLHISFAVKQNPYLGQEILSLVRGHSLPLVSFVISVVLSIARVQRFEEIALNLLKTAVVRSFQDSKMCKYVTQTFCSSHNANLSHCFFLYLVD
jgi:Fanconi anemia group I protein